MADINETKIAKDRLLNMYATLAEGKALYKAQAAVTFTASFAGAAINDIKMGDSINDVMRKMKPYYLKKNSGEWLTYLMPNGQMFDFRFNSSFLDQITIREAPG